MKLRFRLSLGMFLLVTFLASGLVLAAVTTTPSGLDKPSKRPVVFTPEQLATVNLSAVKESLEFSALSTQEKIKATMKNLGFTVLAVTEDPSWDGVWQVSVYGWFKSTVAPVYVGGLSRINGSEYIYFPNDPKPIVQVAPVGSNRGWFLWLNSYPVQTKIGLKWNNTILNKGGVGVGPFVK